MNKVSVLSRLIIIEAAALLVTSSTGTDTPAAADANPSCPLKHARSPVPAPIRMWDELCLVSTKHEFVYLPVPKTGSSSVRELLLEQLCGYRGHTLDFDEHCQPDVLKRAPCKSLLKKRYESFTFFAVVRDPWPRASSTWTYGKLCYDIFKKERQEKGARKAMAALPEYPDFGAALGAGGYYKLPRGFLNKQSSHFGPQAPFLVDRHTGASAVDYHARVERLGEDLACMFPSLFNSSVAVPHSRRFTHENPEDEEAQGLAQVYYAADFLLLGSESLGIPPSPMRFRLGCSPLECWGHEPCQPSFCNRPRLGKTVLAHSFVPSRQKRQTPELR